MDGNFRIIADLDPPKSIRDLERRASSLDLTPRLVTNLLLRTTLNKNNGQHSIPERDFLQSGACSEFSIVRAVLQVAERHPLPFSASIPAQNASASLLFWTRVTWRAVSQSIAGCVGPAAPALLYRYALKFSEYGAWSALQDGLKEASANLTKFSVSSLSFSSGLFHPPLQHPNIFIILMRDLGQTSLHVTANAIEFSSESSPARRCLGGAVSSAGCQLRFPDVMPTHNLRISSSSGSC